MKTAISPQEAIRNSEEDIGKIVDQTIEDINNFLLKNYRGMKLYYPSSFMPSDKRALDIVINNYRSQGWNITRKYQETDFIDDDFMNYVFSAKNG